MPIDKHRLGFHLFAYQRSHSIHARRRQEVRSVDRGLLLMNCISFVRASREEMIQRAGTDVNSRGPRVPDGPPVTAMANSTDKGFTFSQLP